MLATELGFQVVDLLMVIACQAQAGPYARQRQLFVHACMTNDLPLGGGYRCGTCPPSV
eukprot:jgi/Mesvir1/996/Mv25685-RA.1